MAEKDPPAKPPSAQGEGHAAPAKPRESNQPERSASDQQHASENPKSNRIERIRRFFADPGVGSFVNIGVAIGTIALAGIAYCQMRDARHIAHGQLREIKVEQRAWVSAEISIAPSGLYYGPFEGALDIVLKLTNTGRSPAFNVRWDLLKLFNKDGVASVVLPMEADCEKLRNESPRAMTGAVIFPGETKTFKVTVHDAIVGAPVDGGGVIYTAVAGCIDYLLAKGQTRAHQTRFVYQVSTSSDGHDIEALHFLQPYTVDQLRLDPYDGVLPGYAAFAAD